MTTKEFYGPAFDHLKQAENQLLHMAQLYAEKNNDDFKPVVYICSRIKSPESILRKLEQRGFTQTVESSLDNLYDTVCMRIICAFVEDVYRTVEWLREQPRIQIVEEKDYYTHPKPNGYRSYHILLKIQLDEGTLMRAEIQVRTIATDFWATLEHQLKYKKSLPHEALSRSELKHCADDIASVDLSMQTIREIIYES